MHRCMAHVNKNEFESNSIVLHTYRLAILLRRWYRIVATVMTPIVPYKNDGPTEFEYLLLHHRIEPVS